VPLHALIYVVVGGLARISRECSLDPGDVHWQPTLRALWDVGVGALFCHRGPLLMAKVPGSTSNAWRRKRFAVVGFCRMALLGASNPAL
jgi:hypothetical protein